MMIPWGDDFTYGNAKMTYTSVDDLIKYFNEKYDDMTLLYSTPSNYIKSLKESKLVWPSKYGDMMPYSDEKNGFWSGYFTSRANDKAQGKAASANLHGSNKIFAQVVIDQASSDETIKEVLEAKDTMFDALGVFQHHDAITGTGM